MPNHSEVNVQNEYNKLSAKEKALYSFEQFQSLYLLIQCSEEEKKTSLINPNQLINPTDKVHTTEQSSAHGLIHAGKSIIS